MQIFHIIQTPANAKSAAFMFTVCERCRGLHCGYRGKRSSEETTGWWECADCGCRWKDTPPKGDAATGIYHS